MNILMMLLLSALAAAGDEPQVKPAAPVQDPERPALSLTELKALRDNIFSPRNAKRAPVRVDRSTTRPSAPTPYKQKAPVVTGIFLDPSTLVHHAIVEDKNDSAHKVFKEPKFMKPGDEWAGIKLESVTQDKAVFNKGGTTKDVRIGESLPESEEKPLSAAEPSDDFIADDGETPAVESASKSSKAARPETKTVTPEGQSKTIEEMKRRLKKKSRPGDSEE
jgi:hypothetical protein